MGLYELLASLRVPGKPSSEEIRNDPQKYWSANFTLPKNFGYSFATDGVSVSKSMVRKVRKNNLPCSNKNCKIETNEEVKPFGLDCYEGIVAVDPGAKTPIVTCNLRKEGRYEYRTLSKKQVDHVTGKYELARRLNRWTRDMECLIGEDPDNGKELSFKNPNTHLAFLRLKLKHFERKQTVYERSKVVRLNFDRYTRRQKIEHNIVRETFLDGKKQVKPGEKKTLILYGNGCKFMNTASFKGHGKFFHNAILKTIRTYYKDSLEVRVVDESYTTKTCSCMDALFVSSGGHRYVFCSKCRKGTHRDRNAARNILQKHTPLNGQSSIDDRPRIISDIPKNFIR